MAISEQDRHDMRMELERVLGPEAAATMMEHLPPVGWADIATKRDLEHLEMSLQRDMSRLEAALSDRLRVQQQVFMGALLTSVLAIVGVLGALVALT